MSTGGTPAPDVGPGWVAQSWGRQAPPASCHLPPPRRERRLQAERGLARVRAFFNAPVVVFHLNTLSYFSFLCLFAYVLMVDFQPTPSWCERVVYLWLFSLFCEELRQARPPPAPHPPPLPRERPERPRPPCVVWGRPLPGPPSLEGQMQSQEPGPSLSPSPSRGPSCLGLGDTGTRAGQAGRGFQGGPGDRALLPSGLLQELEAGWLLTQRGGSPTHICMSGRVRGQQPGLTPRPGDPVPPVTPRPR